MSFSLYDKKKTQAFEAIEAKSTMLPEEKEDDDGWTKVEAKRQKLNEDAHLKTEPQESQEQKLTQEENEGWAFVSQRLINLI
jgi:hypothetical protein